MKSKETIILQIKSIITRATGRVIYDDTAEQIWFIVMRDTDQLCSVQHWKRHLNGHKELLKTSHCQTDFYQSFPQGDPATASYRYLIRKPGGVQFSVYSDNPNLFDG